MRPGMAASQGSCTPRTHDLCPRGCGPLEALRRSRRRSGGRRIRSSQGPRPAGVVAGRRWVWRGWQSLSPWGYTLTFNDFHHLDWSANFFIECRYHEARLTLAALQSWAAAVSVMIVCHCRRVTDREIRRCVRSGGSTVSAVSEACGAATGCGGCRPLVSKIVQAELEAEPRCLPVIGPALVGA